MRKMKAIQLSACAVLSVLFAISLLAGAADAITNGQPDGNNHPYVGLVVFDWDHDNNPSTPPVPGWRCTGSLLSPTVVLVAGHCTDGAVAARVWFDPGPIPMVTPDNPYQPGVREYPYSGVLSYDGIPHTYPDFAIGAGKGVPGFAHGDVGIVVLTEPVPTSVVSQYAQLPAAGLVDTLPVMTDVDLVGYGVQYQVQPRKTGPRAAWTGLRQRFYAPAKLLSRNFAWSDEFIRCTANPGLGGGTAFGDSGGPVLLAGTRKILAVNSYVTNANCAGETYHFRIDTPEVLKWIIGFM